MLDTFKQVTDGKRRQLTHCNRCGHTSIHRIEVEFEAKWDEGEGYYGGEEHRILRCGGCDSIKYSVTSWDSQDWVDDENGESFPARSTKVYPAPLVKKIEADYLFNLPFRIYHVLMETLDAQSNNNLILATVGLRILIETICDASKCTSKTLFQKINELEKNGLINVEEKELFHKVRTFGNKGAHLGEAMSAVQIASGLDISIHLLEKIFVDPAKKKKLFAKAKASLSP